MHPIMFLGTQLCIFNLLMAWLPSALFQLKCRPFNKKSCLYPYSNETYLEQRNISKKIRYATTFNTLYISEVYDSLR